MADASDSGANLDGTYLPLASQHDANNLLIPLCLGWQLQLVLCGLATCGAIRVLRERQAMKALRSVPGGTILLVAATLFNISAAMINAAEQVTYLSTQQRSLDGLSLIRPIDIPAPLLAALVGIATQAFMTLRCVKVLRTANHRIAAWCFAFPMTILLTASLSGAVWVTVTSYQLMRSTSPDDVNMAWFLDSAQIFLWTGMAVDVAITAFLTVHLRKLRGQGGFNKQTDSYVDSLIKVSFGTFLIPTVTNLVAAILYVVTYDTELANWAIFPATIAPSLYLLSFVFCIAGTHRQQVRHASISAQGQHSSTGTISRSNWLSEKGGIASFRVDAISPSCSSPPPLARAESDKQDGIRFASSAIISWDGPKPWEIEGRAAPEPHDQDSAPASLDDGRYSSDAHSKV